MPSEQELGDRVYYSIDTFKKLEVSDGKPTGYAEVIFCGEECVGSERFEGREKVFPPEFLEKIEAFGKLIAELKEMKHQVRFVFNKNDGKDHGSHPLS